MSSATHFAVSLLVVHNPQRVEAQLSHSPYQHHCKFPNHYHLRRTRRDRQRNIHLSTVKEEKAQLIGPDTSTAGSRGGREPEWMSLMRLRMFGGTFNKPVLLQTRVYPSDWHDREGDRNRRGHPQLYDLEKEKEKNENR